MPAWIISLVVNFILRQVAKYADNTDWNKVKADAHARLAPLLPDWMEIAANDVVDNVIDVVAIALQDTNDLKDIATKLLNKDIGGAIAALISLIGKIIHPNAQVVLHILQNFKF